MNQCSQGKAFLLNAMAKKSCKRNKGVRQLLIGTKVNRQCLLTMRQVPSSTGKKLESCHFHPIRKSW